MDFNRDGLVIVIEHLTQEQSYKLGPYAYNEDMDNINHVVVSKDGKVLLEGHGWERNGEYQLRAGLPPDYETNMEVPEEYAIRRAYPFSDADYEALAMRIAYDYI